MLRAFFLSALLLGLIVAGMAPPAQAAEGMSARAAQRLALVMSSAAEQPEEALEELKRLLRNRSLSSTDRAFIAHERAVLLLQRDQPEAALAEMFQAMAEQDESFLPQLRVLIAQILLLQERSEEALGQFEIWYRNTEDRSPRVLIMMAYTQLQLERFMAASEVLEVAIDLAETPEGAWYELLAFAYIQTERHREAERLLLDVIAQRPLQAKWWQLLSTVNLLLEDIPQGAAASAISQHLQELELDDARRLAGLFSAVNMPLDAAQLWERALGMSASPRSFEDQMLLAELWILAREIEPALRALEAAVPLSPSSEPLLKRAHLYLRREAYPEARDELIRAIAFDAQDSHAEAYYLLTIVEINLGNYPGALESLRHIEGEDEFAARAERLSRFLEQQVAGRLQ